ncbi:MAG: pantoate--beta-alanine ligase [Planctomycetes bacterium]|nr:pantoate--beta-alanine ligase [Planctomycetota bacterium]
MEEFTTISGQRAWSLEQRRAGKTIGFVPTMGALHEGHLTLVRRARERCDRVVVSVYVNPTQFDNPEDLAKYPVTLEQDRQMLAQEGVDALWLPTSGEMYPDGYCTFVELVGPLMEGLCAVARPGHFRGVATVVAKLFNVVQPDVAVFGQKDLQQVMIISRMVADLNLPIEVVVGPTVREPDGLAMSSRNRRLSVESRAKAIGLPTGLELANRAFKQGETNSLKLTELVYNELLVHPGVEVDYANVVKLPKLEEAETAGEACVLAAAVFIDGIRLIDHVLLGGASIPVKVDE